MNMNRFTAVCLPVVFEIADAELQASSRFVTKWLLYLISEPVRLPLVRCQLFLPLLHVGVRLVQRRHQLGVAVLQSEEL